MDELKRWREERSLRQSLRVLRDYKDPEDVAGSRLLRRTPRLVIPKTIDLCSRTARGIRWVSITAEARDTATLREAEALRSLGPISKSLVESDPSGGFRIWPKPPKVSPVHPEWDDPTGGRFKWSFYRSMALHLLLIPGVLLLTKVKFTLGEPDYRAGRVFTIVMPPPGTTSGGGAKKPKTAPPPPAEKKTEPEKPKEQKKQTPKPKPVPAKPVEKKESAVPVPTKDKDLPKTVDHAKGTPPAKTPPAEEREPVTDPVAQAGPDFAQGPSGPGSSPGSFTSMGLGPGVDFPYNYYLETIRSGIAKVWQVPQGLVSKGRRLNAIVQFRINRDGSIAQATIEEPSGFAFFDQAALRAVSLVRRFPPLPQEFGGNFLLVHFQFTYTGQ